MNITRIIYTSSVLMVLIVLVVGCSFGPSGNEQNIKHAAQRQEIDFNFGWKFSLEEDLPDGSIVYSESYDDSQWRDIRLPHDWSIEAEYSQINTAGATGYLPGGKGWYRKTFTTPNYPVGERTTNNQRKTQILFDGVYNHSKVWINGHLLGERPYGYSAFHYDLTPYLNTDGKPNVLAVFVDHSRYVDSRWYTGSGIYRNVKLITTNKTHIPIWGSYVTTPKVSDSQASVLVETKVQTDAVVEKPLQVLTELKDSAGNTLATTEKTITVSSLLEIKVSQTLEISNPQLWSPESPNLYYVVTSLIENQNLIDSNTVTTGFRYYTNDPQQGFFLNGRSTKIKGVNIHHDGGLVGAAVPKGVWKRRLQTLKEAGVNAIRTSHNPASAEFLDLCDEMGFLVQAEAFDEWDNPKDKRKNFNQSGEIDYITQSYSQYFEQWAERDIKAMLLRDRNHPSIFQWSIGNEIEWTYPRYTNATGYWEKSNKGKANYYWDTPPYSQTELQQRFNTSPVQGAELSKTAANLAKWTKELDTTRPVTANLIAPSISHFSGYAEVLDVIGYSYRQSIYELGHHTYPDKMILGTENWVQWHEWQIIEDKPYIPGIFVWTGINYLGESNGDWPKKGSGSGMLDFAGFTKPSYHMMKTIWNEEPHIYLTTQPLADSVYTISENKVVEKEPESWKRAKWGWRPMNKHWNYQENQNIVVEVYTNQLGVELFLNNKPLGVRYLQDNPDHILKWPVPYSSGKLTAKALDSELAVSLDSADEPVNIQLSVDKTSLAADSYDVAHVTAQLIDKNGYPVYHQNKKIEFTVNGALTSLGVDNGASDNIQKHQSNTITTDQGRALLIVQSKDQLGKAQISASLNGKVSSTLEITIE